MIDLDGEMKNKLKDLLETQIASLLTKIDEESVSHASEEEEEDDSS